MPNPCEKIALNQSNKGDFELSLPSTSNPEEVESCWGYNLAEVSEEARDERDEDTELNCQGSQGPDEV